MNHSAPNGEPIRVALPLKALPPQRSRRMLEMIAQRGIEFSMFAKEPWRPEHGSVMLIIGNLNWHPEVCRQLSTEPVDQLPRTVIWHWEPLPPPRRSGLPRPWLDHREIAKILLRDKRATDPYTNLSVLRRLAQRGLPHRLMASTRERVELLADYSIESEYLPLGYHTEQGGDLGLERDLDVLFLGVGSLRRSIKLFRLRMGGAKVLVMGGWREPECWDDNRTRLLNRTRIFLNIPRFRGQFAKLRFSIGAANKTLILSEPLYSSAPFVPGQHYVAATWKEMPNVIRYYLEHEEERRKIAEAAHDMVVNTETLSDSLDRVAEVLRELHESAVVPC